MTQIEMFIGDLQPFHQMPRRSRSATSDDGLGLARSHVRESGHQGHPYFYNEDIPVDLLRQRLCGLRQGHIKYRGTTSRLLHLINAAQWVFGHLACPCFTGIRSELQVPVVSQRSFRKSLRLECNVYWC
jgi:hypothetical protein